MVEMAKLIHENMRHKNERWVEHRVDYEREDRCTAEKKSGTGGKTGKTGTCKFNDENVRSKI